MKTAEAETNGCDAVVTEAGRLDEVVDAEIVKDMNKAQAREITKKIRRHLDNVWELIKQAYSRRAWAALGYQTWDAYCASEFDTGQLRLPLEERSEVMCSLREAGMSERAISAATGLGKTTVHRGHCHVS
jgi:DNA invertase Pin-like site-specific DNA recombinase